MRFALPLQAQQRGVPDVRFMRVPRRTYRWFVQIFLDVDVAPELLPNSIRIGAEMTAARAMRAPRNLLEGSFIRHEINVAVDYVHLAAWPPMAWPVTPGRHRPEPHHETGTDGDDQI